MRSPKGDKFKKPPATKNIASISHLHTISDEGAQRLDIDEAKSYPVDRARSEELPSSSQQQHVSQYVGDLDAILTWMRIFDSKISGISECVRESSLGLRERNSLHEEGLEPSYRDPSGHDVLYQGS